MSFADEWARSRREVQQGDWEPPAGAYHVRITSGDAFEGNDGRRWAKVILEAVDGPHAGKSWTHIMGLQGGAMNFTLEALLGYGLDLNTVEEWSDLQEAMLGLVDRDANVTVSHSGGYVNTRVSGSRTGTSDVPSGPPPATAPAPGKPAQPTFPGVSRDDDDIPF
jgi:hypothetical protein